jgi:hypothetical protein
MTEPELKICRCSDHFEIEMQTNSDCIEFVCATCNAEAAADAKRAQWKDEVRFPDM